MNMVPSSAAASHQSSGPSSVIPPPLPRPPPAPTGPGSSQMSGHPGHQSMSAPYGHPAHRPQQQSHGMGPGGPSYPPMPSQSPSSRGGPPGMPPGSSHPPGPAPSPYHRPLHSPANTQRQPSHHHPHQPMPPHHHQHHHSMHPPQPHHPGMQSHQQQIPPQQQYHQPHRQQQHPPQAGPPHQQPSHQQIPHAPSGSGSSSSQQPTYLPKGLNGDWQSDKDMKHRRQMIQNIVKLLKQRDKNASQEWLNKLPQMVKQLEVSLYRSAPSFEAYADTKTLKHRLQLLAMEIAKKTGQSQVEDKNGSNTRRSEHRPPYPNGVNNSRQSAHGSQSPFGMQMPSSRSDSLQVPGRSQPSGSRQIHRGNNPTNADNRPQVVRMNEINPMMGGNSTSLSQPSLSTTDRNRRSASGSFNPSSSSQNRNDPELQQRIRHKQQRLLLLHHSSKCEYDENCPVTPHCADMKRLWKHMSKCTDTNCRVSHCYSSRSILSHFRKCKNPQCPACGPVRDTVRKSGKRSDAGSLSSNSNDSARYNGPGASSSGGNGGSLSMNPPSGMGYPNQNQNLNLIPPQSNEGLSAPSRSNRPMSLSSGSSTQFPPHQRPPSQPDLSSNGNYGSGSGSLYRSGVGNNMNKTNSPHDLAQQPFFPPGKQSPPTSTSPMALPEPTRIKQIGHTRTNTNGVSSASSTKSSSDKHDPELERIRHKQQRLLLLRHASKCTAEDGKCKITPHCAGMKSLWKHISGCQNTNCKVSHCMSSRYVLSHYRRCKDARCPACGPVRESIRKSNERGERHASPMVTGSNKTSSSYDDIICLPVSSQQPPPPSLSDIPTSTHNDISPSGSNIYQPPPKRPRKVEPAVNYSAPGSISTPSRTQPQALLSNVLSSPNSPQNENKVRSTTPPVAPMNSSFTKPAPAPSVPPSAVCEPVTTKSRSDDNTCSLISSFTIDQIELHINSLNRTVQLPPQKLKAKCSEILKSMQNHQHGWVFNTPVDPVELGLPDYFDIIKKPMDLGSIQKKLHHESYHSIDEFKADVCLTFDNAMRYNEQGSVVHDMANELKTKFLADYKKLLQQLKKEEEDRRKNERACCLCGCEKLLFEPPVFFCNGLKCPSKRISRNRYFYVGGSGSNQFYWCNQCYNELDDNAKIEVHDLTLQKTELKKKKNDEIHEESWVQCDTCERWIHQICGLFNSRQNKDNGSKYSCPQCLIKELKAGKITPQPNALTAEELPRTKLSEWLENHVRNKVVDQYKILAQEKAEMEEISFEEAHKIVSGGGHITVRQVTATDRKLEVREGMKRRYAHKNYPEEFPFRCKCVVVFQNLDGVDVILFALYVYEHGEDNPPPNERTVYISYLDSVHFMRPRKLRTFVYHEILIAYLDYARQKGFAIAHIWACPPYKGDDYIFYAKPEDQKTPRDSRLRQWYIDMLVECQKRDIVGKLTNMYELYFSNEKLDATSVPYLEGDYFCGEAENIIKELEEGRSGGKLSKKSKKKKSNGNSNGNKAKNKSKNGRNGTRSTGMDEETAATETSVEVNEPASVSTRDEVMVKMGPIIQPMKESFIVAFLNWKGAKEEDMVVPQEIMDCREKIKQEEEASKSSKPPDIISTSFGTKRDSNGNPRSVSFESTSGKDLRDRNGKTIKIIDDDLEELDCEFLNNRQAFLNLCRGNHYQFDELRRAKHTSMMVLWHLHNRHAAKFVQQCASCSREILSGIRYHCPTCSGFDLCQECYNNPKTNRGLCNHDLQRISVDGDSSKGGTNEGPKLSEAQRKERQRNIQLHIQLIEHASRCNSSSCTSSNCAKMKQYLNHGAKCKVKVAGDCKICKRIWTLLRYHAQSCKNKVCTIPQCMQIRDRIRVLAKQQQAMDDRRRQEMNRHYRMGAGSG